ncbi:MAG TPA: hypothetical protein VF765_17600 [Polyangiaceae bacterium]
MPLRAAILALVSLALLVAGETRAGADERDKEACIRAVEHAQVARLDGKLREAREGFVMCARAVCPEAIRQDCTRWVTDVDASLPSVVFEAVWADGHDATGMRVLVDGKPLGDTEPGRAVVLDPGEHTFRFEVPGASPVETRNVVREGEKNRVVRVTFEPVAPPPSPAPPGETTTSGSSSPASVPAPANLWQTVPTAERRPLTGRRPVPLGAYILGGVGLVSFVGFGALALDGTSRLDGMRSGPGSCAPNCNPSDVTSARNEILVGDILGYVGIAATSVALWLALARP